MSLTAKLGLPAPPRPNRQPRARSSATLHEMAQFPRRAHWAWRGLPLAQQFQVLALMSMTHGKAFANAFVGYTRGGAVFEDAHYVPALAHQTPAWFASRGYKLAQRCSVSQWWVHPSGHQILLVIQMKGAPSPEDAVLRAAIDALLNDLAEVTSARDATSSAKAALVGRQDIYTDDYAIAYEAYVASLEALADDMAARLGGASDTRARLAGAQRDAYDQLLASLGAIEAWVHKRLDEDELSLFAPLDPSDEDPIDLSQPGSAENN